MFDNELTPKLAKALQSRPDALPEGVGIVTRLSVSEGLGDPDRVTEWSVRLVAVEWDQEGETIEEADFAVSVAQQVNVVANPQFLDACDELGGHLLTVAEIVNEDIDELQGEMTVIESLLCLKNEEARNGGTDWALTATEVLIDLVSRHQSGVLVADIAPVLDLRTKRLGLKRHRGTVVLRHLDLEQTSAPPRPHRRRGGRPGHSPRQ